MASSSQDPPVLNGTGRWIGSARMAVILVSLVAVACALGTLIPQGREPAFYSGAYGSIQGKLLNALSLDNLFYAPWFICLLMLVAVNLVVSNWNRFRKLTGSAAQAPVIEDFTESPDSTRLHIPATMENARERIMKSLCRMGYGTREEKAGYGTYLFSEKGRLRRWGSLVTHLGILFVFTGVITGHLPGMGFQGFTILSHSINRGIREFSDPPFSLKLTETGSKVSEEGRPLDYYSTVEVIEEKKIILKKTIRVNDPLEYRGINFYQSTFGMLGFYLHAKDRRGTLYRVPLRINPGGEAHAEVPEQVGTTGIYVSLHVFAGDYDEKRDRPGPSSSYSNPAAVIFVFEGRKRGSDGLEKAAGLVSKKRHFTFRDLDFSMGELIPYTGIYYRKDPGVPMVWLGFLVTIVGVCISFYINEKSITLLFLPGETGERLFVRTGAHLDYDFDEELGELKKCLEEN